MHGNTQKVGDFKTRKLEDVKEVKLKVKAIIILKEILKAMRIFHKFGNRLHGIHLEITPDEVTECLGGSHSQVTERDLARSYTSLCDPRLNFSQVNNKIRL